MSELTSRHTTGHARSNMALIDPHEALAFIAIDRWYVAERPIVWQ